MTDPTSDLAARLSESVAAELTGQVSEAELVALRRYQALDRTYALVNQVLRAERHPDELADEEFAAVRALVRDLDDLLARWRTPEPVRVYRGLRSRTGLRFGQSPVVSRSFLSTTLFRDVAVAEFTTPPGTGGPALLEIVVPSGTPAIWVPPLGDPALAYQGELLLGREVRLAVRDRSVEAGILVVDCEVEQ
jgi:hypothetical protein